MLGEHFDRELRCRAGQIREEGRKGLWECAEVEQLAAGVPPTAHDYSR
jgi:hypothetical protein